MTATDPTTENPATGERVAPRPTPATARVQTPVLCAAKTHVFHGVCYPDKYYDYTLLRLYFKSDADHSIDENGANMGD